MSKFSIASGLNQLLKKTICIFDVSLSMHGKHKKHEQTIMKLVDFDGIIVKIQFTWSYYRPFTVIDRHTCFEAFKIIIDFDCVICVTCYQ